MKKFIKYLYIFLSHKKVFRKPRKAKILIYDSTGYEDISSYFDKNNVEIFDKRNEINLYVLALSVLKFKFDIESYKKIYLNLVDPEIAVTFIDNDRGFYNLKKINSKIKTIFIQNGYRDNKHNDIFLYIYY